MARRGYFITFEGGEGSGKGTQIRRARRYLRDRNWSVLVAREPGGTRVGEAVRRILLSNQFKNMKFQTELLLYLAARAELVREKILPALREGKIVLCDRYEDSTLAYQGYGRNLAPKTIQRFGAFVRMQVKPDLTFLLDMTPREGIKRSGRQDRMERAPLRFHQRVRAGFHKLARREARRFVVISGHLPKSEVWKKIKETLDRVFTRSS